MPPFSDVSTKRAPNAAIVCLRSIDKCSGIFNLGSGRAQSFNDVAVATVNAMRRADGATALSLGDLQAEGIVRYVPFPEGLKEKYQNFTEADLGRLREIGYEEKFLTIEDGVGHYIDWLRQQ